MTCTKHVQRVIKQSRMEQVRNQNPTSCDSTTVNEDQLGFSTLHWV
ncbi:hypothetical protein JCM19239_3335 [Vibrio variabilis]|uniref:Uncharacterized protein n=1 Tax=Vibrio variabilis TaxID=990271 RepID=A0ABQ0JH82_9VIBR|nr:hypothetical protein JCM19239_3335 [Vibrio variabilis]